tara:strand:+ start:12259 stop:12480 length:222 start_codon:yes stop_codon:yes gene_type:complete
MKEDKLISDGASFVLKSLKREDLNETIYYDPENLKLFLGTIAGLIQGIGEVLATEDHLLYIRLLESVERLALR